MRFGKRNRNPLAMGWRAKSQPAMEYGIVASEERDALLYSPPAPEEDCEFPPDNGISPATRRLATALGRFERQVARAREGAPQEAWSDECMNQLINAVEIAVAEGWEEVVEVLAETGRILQSYENEGQAHLCVPFLTESYEILSQMVSDLILGKVRSGLMQKWRNRYRMALEDLKDAGIRLVRDEDEDRRAGRTPAKNTAAARWTPNREPEAEESPRIFPFEMPPADGVPAAHASTTFETPRIEDYLGEPEPEEESPTDEAALDAETTPDDAWAGSPGAAEWMAEAATEDAVEEELDDLPRLGDELPPLAPLAPLGGNLLELGDEPEVPAEDLPQAGFGGTAPAVIEQLDVLCERLSHMEREAEPDLDGGFDTIGYAVLFLEEQADIYGRPACIELCRAMSRLCDSAHRRGVLPEDKFFELAYAFCGVYVEADAAADDETIASWIAESESVIAGWAQVRVEEEPAAAVEPEVAAEPEVEEVIEDAVPETPAVEFAAEPEPDVEEDFVDEYEPETVETVETVEPTVEDMEIEEPAGELQCEAPDQAETVSEEPETVESAIETVGAARETVAQAPVAAQEDDSAEQLLLVAQRAMTEGNAGEAKRLALQAAAMLAQIEVDEAARRVADAERRLREGASLTDQARADVQRAEQVVAETARSVGDGQKALETRRAEITAISQKLAEVEGLVEGLDEQIRQLQAKRDEEARRLADTRTELDSAHSREALTQADLAARAEAEQEARVRLEDARQRVKNLQRKRTEVESTMERAREALTQRRASLADIEQMLSHVNGRPTVEEEPDAGEFLF